MIVLLLVGTGLPLLPFRVGVLIVHAAVLVTLFMAVAIAFASPSRDLSKWIYLCAYGVLYAHTLLLIPFVRGWTAIRVTAETQSFLTVAFSMLLFLLALLLRLREIRRQYARAQLEVRAQREARARDQQTLVHDLHDGLGGMAANISMMAALGQCAPDASAKDEQFRAIEGMAVHAGGEVRAMMNMLDRREIPWADWVLEMHAYAEQAAKPAALSLEWRLAGSVAGTITSAAGAISLMRAIKEAIHNVVKHAAARTLVLALDFGADALTIRVRDDGRGFDPATQRPGKGLTSIRRRLLDLGGQVQLQPAHPGLEVTLHLPLPLKYPDRPDDNPAHNPVCCPP